MCTIAHAGLLHFISEYDCDSILNWSSSCDWPPNTIWPLREVQILSFFILCAAASLLQSPCYLFQWKLKTNRQEKLWLSNWGRIVICRHWRVARKLYGKWTGLCKGRFCTGFTGASNVQGEVVCRGGCNAWIVQRQLYVCKARFKAQTNPAKVKEMQCSFLQSWYNSLYFILLAPHSGALRITPLRDFHPIPIPSHPNPIHL